MDEKIIYDDLIFEISVHKSFDQIRTVRQSANRYWEGLFPAGTGLLVSYTIIDTLYGLNWIEIEMSICLSMDGIKLIAIVF